MILKVHSIVPVSISIFIAIIYVFSSFIVTNSSFAHSDNYNNTPNQTMENKGQPPNKTDENVQQGSNQTR